MSIDYQVLVDEAMLSIVKTILGSTAEKGLVGEQSFYISFKTDSAGVVLSPFIKKKYPKEITIVLQYQFKNLVVFEDNFTVNLAFGGVPETIAVPFSALTSFIDPIANFSLQFNRAEEKVPFEAETFSLSTQSDSKIKNKSGAKKSEVKQMKPKPATKVPAPKGKKQKEGKVIAINKFRKKEK